MPTGSDLSPTANPRFPAIVAATATPTPETPTIRKNQDDDAKTPLYHVVLLDDDEHTYDYVVEMLTKLFCLSSEAAFRNAMEVDATGRTIIITCELPQAEFGRDQIHAYGADPRMSESKGPMSARVEPAGPAQ